MLKEVHTRLCPNTGHSNPAYSLQRSWPTPISVGGFLVKTKSRSLRASARLLLRRPAHSSASLLATPLSQSPWGSLHPAARPQHFVDLARRPSACRKQTVVLGRLSLHY